jgi:hypothetical protein
MQALRHILSWNLVAALLIGQTGVSLHQIYCYCKGEWEARLFEAKTITCEAHEPEAAHPIPSCCSHDGFCNMEIGAGDQHLPCKEDQTVYLQLDKPAIPVKDADSFQPISWPDAVVSLPASSTTIHLPVPVPANALLRAPPFRYDGRTLQTWVQSFRC